MPEADPFADPIAPRIIVSHPNLNMPEVCYLDFPSTFTNWYVQTENCRDIHGPIVMPQWSIAFKTYPLGPLHTFQLQFDTGRFGIPAETESVSCSPLFRPGTPRKHKLTSHFQSSPHFHSHLQEFACFYSRSYFFQSTTSNASLRDIIRQQSL